MAGPYSQAGAKLVALGYAAIPIMPNSKRPGELRGGEWVGKTNWRAEYTQRLPSKHEIEKWSDSDAGVCVVCGPGSRNLVAIDIDIDDESVRDAILSACPETPVAKKGAKGATYFYRGEGIDKSKSWNIPWGSNANYRACDLIGPGRQTVLPPTIHPDTEQPYVWIGERALEDTPADELPVLTPAHIEAIGKALEEFGYDRKESFVGSDEAKPRYDRDDSEQPEFRRLNNAAMDNFDSWVPKLGLRRCRRWNTGYEAVAEWRSSGSGQDFSKRKFNLKFHSDGIVDFGDGPRAYTPINVVIEALDMGRDNVSQAYAWLSDALGWNDGPLITIGNGDAPPTAPETEEALPAEPKAEPKQDDYHAEIERLSHCKGLVGEVTDWIVDTAQRPNRALALGAAVTLIGTLIGRRVAGPTQSATHLYWLALGSTASGKQHPIDCLKRIMIEAGAGDHLGPSQFMSDSAVINLVARKPLCIVPMDEFGAYIGRINSRKAGTHQRGISETLRTLWGTSFEYYTTPEWAGRSASQVAAPAMSIFGVGTPDEFYDGLQSAEAKNGFLNRFLVVNARRGPAVTPKLPKGDVPEGIKTALAELYRWGGGHGSLGTARLNDESCMPKPLVLNWSSQAAKDCFVGLQQYIEDRTIKTPQIEHYMGRTAEIAVRLATIRSVGRWGPHGDGPTIDLSDIEWGRDLAVVCGERLAKDGAAYVADNDRQQWSNRVLEVIRSKGTAKPRDIQRAINCALKSSDIKDIVDQLCESGRIESIKGEMKGGKIGKVGYRFVGE